MRRYEKLYSFPGTLLSGIHLNAYNHSSLPFYVTH